LLEYTFSSLRAKNPILVEALDAYLDQMAE